MINRNLIRIRVVQLVYSWYKNTNSNLQNAEKELLFGLQKSYDLYYYFLSLIIELTDTYENRVEKKRNKFLPSESDQNPHMQLIDNKFVRQLRTNIQFNKYMSDRPMSWEQNESFVKRLLDTIIESDVYKSYAEMKEVSYGEDREFWRKVFKNFIYNNEEIYDILEDESIFWNDDIETVQTFVLKTIKQFSEERGENQPLLPMFKDEEDKRYALKLLHISILDEKKIRSLIESHTDKWDFERIAFMDLIIMQVAIAEIITFDSIPTTVTLNEFIEIAKSYSTNKSGIFVNGILDSVVRDLKKENLIFKN